MNAHQRIKAICDQHNLTLDRLRSPSRVRSLVQVRQEVMRVLYREYHFSQMEIAKMLNRKDHSTVSYGIEQAEYRIERACRLGAQERVVA